MIGIETADDPVTSVAVALKLSFVSCSCAAIKVHATPFVVDESSSLTVPLIEALSPYMSVVLFPDKFVILIVGRSEFKSMEYFVQLDSTMALTSILLLPAL